MSTRSLVSGYNTVSGQIEVGRGWGWRRLLYRSVLQAGIFVSCKMILLVDEARTKIVEKEGGIRRGCEGAAEGKRACTAKLLLLRASRESRWIGGTTAIACIRKRSHGARRNSLALCSELTKQFAFQKRETITHA